MGLGSAAGRVDVAESDQLKGETHIAAKIIDDAGIKEPAAETVLIQSEDPSVKATDAGFRSAVADVVKAVDGTGKVTGITSPYTTGTISKDGRSALVQFDMRGDAETAADRVEPVLDAVAGAQQAHGTLRIAEIGGASMDKQYGDAFGKDFRRAEYSAVPVAFGILLIAFGALVAALLPVGLAITAIMATMGLVSHLQPMSDTANSVMLLVGMAVGVDYCLFYLRREREEREAGRDAGAALRIAAVTSGRAVIVSGVTVCVAMAGMLLTGLAEFEAMGLASLMVVAVAMVGSVTVLPALLSLHQGRDPARGGHHGRGRHQRRRDHGRRVRDLRDAVHAVHEADGRGPGGRGPHRRDGHPGRAAAAGDQGRAGPAAGLGTG